MGGSIRRRARPVPAAERLMGVASGPGHAPAGPEPRSAASVGQSDTGDGGGCHHGYLPAQYGSGHRQSRASQSACRLSRAGGFAGTARSLAWELQDRVPAGPAQAGNASLGGLRPGNEGDFRVDEGDQECHVLDAVSGPPVGDHRAEEQPGYPGRGGPAEEVPSLADQDACSARTVALNGQARTRGSGAGRLMYAGSLPRRKPPLFPVPGYREGCMT